MEITHLPLIKPIAFDVDGHSVQLCDVRSAFVSNSGLNGLVGEQMAIAWNEIYGEDPTLDGHDLDTDPHQVGFIILLDGNPIGSGMFIEVGLVEEDGDPDNVDATGRLILTSEGFPTVATQIQEAADGYEAEAEAGEAYKTVTIHLAA